MKVDTKKFLAHAKQALGVDGWAKLKEKFQEEATEEEKGVVEEKMMEATLKDGTKVSYDTLAEGSKLVVVTTEGEVAAPDGVHELVDGTKVTTAGGLITAVEAVQAAAGEGDDSGAEMMTKETIQKMIDEAVNGIPPKKDEEMAAAFKAIEKENKSLKEDMGKIVGMLDFFMEEAATTDQTGTQKTGKEKKVEVRKSVAQMIAQYQTAK